MLVVQKYGGTSVGSVERIREVAKRCIATQQAGHDVVVIVSAMSGETNRLLEARQGGQRRAAARVRARARRHRRDGRAGLGRPGVAGHPEGGRQGAVVPRLAGAHRHRLGVHARAHQVDRRRRRSTTRSSRARSPSSPAFRASTTTATSPRSAAAARTPAASPSPRRSRPTPARSTPTSTASTPPIPTSCPTRARSTASATRRCWSWRRSAPRCCRSARSSSA